MPALSFTMFVDKVEDGRKTQTIRATRKTPFKVGDWLFLYTGLRTRASRLLTPGDKIPRCVEVKSIYVTRCDADIAVFIDGQQASETAIETLARLDGFDSVKDFYAFFVPECDSVFKGQIIRWKWWGDPIDARDPKIWLPQPEAAR